VAVCAGRGTRRVAKRIVGDVGEEGKRAVRGSEKRRRDGEKELREEREGKVRKETEIPQRGISREIYLNVFQFRDVD